MNEEQKNSQNIEPKERCKPKYMPLPSDNLDDFEIVGDIEAGQAMIFLKALKALQLK